MLACQGGRNPALVFTRIGSLEFTLGRRRTCPRSEMTLTVPNHPWRSTNLDNQSWPEVDPDKDEWLKRWNETFPPFLSIGRTKEEQNTVSYNAARPLPVIGGVSDAEIRFLQMARGIQRQDAIGMELVVRILHP